MHPLPPAFLARPDAVLPMVRGAKVSAGVAHDRDVELLHGLDDVLAEAALVGEGVARVVDAAVNASSHVPRAGSLAKALTLRMAINSERALTQ